MLLISNYTSSAYRMIIGLQKFCYCSRFNIETWETSAISFARRNSRIRSYLSYNKAIC